MGPWMCFFRCERRERDGRWVWVGPLSPSCQHHGLQSTALQFTSEKRGCASSAKTSKTCSGFRSHNSPGRARLLRVQINKRVQSIIFASTGERADPTTTNANSKWARSLPLALFPHVRGDKSRARGHPRHLCRWVPVSSE